MYFRQIKNWIATVVVIGGLAACGGASTDNPNGSNGSGRIGLILTDAPTSEFDEVNITINQIILLNNSGGSTTLYSGEQTVNLLSLQNFGKLLSLTDVPVGQYSKIRLVLKHPDGVELVKRDADGNVISRVFAKQPGNGKLDLNTRGGFTVTANTTIYVQLDVDAKKSIHIVETGNGQYIFRPVVFVDILSEQSTGKLVRQVGYIDNIDAVNKTFFICPSIDITGDTAPNESCTAVNAANASLFDAQAQPITIDNLAVNQSAMVVGVVSFNSLDFAQSDKATDFGDDENHDNGDGKKVNNPGLALGQVKKRQKSMHYQLNAEVVEVGALGQYQVIHGTITSDAADLDAKIDFTINENAAISTQLQPNMKIFARNGIRLDVNAVKNGTSGSFDGVWSNNEHTQLRSTLLILDQADTANEQHVSGTVSNVDLGNQSLTISAKTGSVRISLTNDTQYFRLVENSETVLSDRVQATAISKNARLDIYGKMQTGSILVASVVIIQQLSEQ